VGLILETCHAQSRVRHFDLLSFAYHGLSD